MYEPRSSPVLSARAFATRLAQHVLATALLVGVSLGIGVFGYATFEGLAVIDAFLNASMILGGMGPVNMPNTNAGKVFAGVYALYSGLVFLVCLAIVLTPVFHRVLHAFHMDEDAPD